MTFSLSISSYLSFLFWEFCLDQYPILKLGCMFFLRHIFCLLACLLGWLILYCLDFIYFEHYPFSNIYFFPIFRLSLWQMILSFVMYKLLSFVMSNLLIVNLSVVLMVVCSESIFLCKWVWGFSHIFFYQIQCILPDAELFVHLEMSLVQSDK